MIRDGGGRESTPAPDGGDFISASDYSVDELREVVFEERGGKGTEAGEPGEQDGSVGELDPLVAISLLARKEYDGKREDLRAVVFDESRDQRLRHNAAVAFGRAFGTQAEATLLEALEDAEEPELQRGLLRALGDVGGEETLEAIAQRRGTFAGSLGREADWTETLVAFRTRTDAASEVGRLPEPDLVSFEGRPFDIACREVDDELREAVLSSLRTAQRDLPIDVREDAIFTLDGLNQDLLVVLDGAFREAAGRPLTSKQVAGALLELEDVESGVWTPQYYLFVQPDAPEEGEAQQGEQAGRTGQLYVTTTGGRIHYGGPFRVEDGTLAFEIRAVERPDLRPLRIEGRLVEGDIVFEEGVTGVNAADARQPSPASPVQRSSRD